MSGNCSDIATDFSGLGRHYRYVQPFIAGFKNAPASPFGEQAPAILDDWDA